MRDHARENLTELLRRFMDESAARQAQADIEAGEQILQAHPASLPSQQTLWTIKSLMIATAARRRRRIHIFRAALAAAAVVVVTALVGRYPSGSVDQPRVNIASILPTAIWESHDLTADDLDLAYFTSEIHQIETQMRDLETEDATPRESDVLDDLEIELISIETEFWKG